MTDIMHGEMKNAMSKMDLCMRCIALSHFDVNHEPYFVNELGQVRLACD